MDPDRDDEHRALDSEREMKGMFATPMLNRQMLRGGDGRLSDASSVPSAMRGLGQMHFIRSVIEHHRQGGDDQAGDFLDFLSSDQVRAAFDEAGFQVVLALRHFTFDMTVNFR